MKKYDDLSVTEKSELKLKIINILKESYQKEQNNKEITHNSHISDIALTNILGIAIAYDLIEKACLDNTCYKDKILSNTYGIQSIEEITNQLLQTFSKSPSVEQVVDSSRMVALEAAIEDAFETSNLENENMTDWDMEL